MWHCVLIGPYFNSSGGTGACVMVCGYALTLTAVVGLEPVSWCGGTGACGIVCG